MLSKPAKLFINGGSQAVRLPAEFRFEGSSEVFVRRDVVTGNLIISQRPLAEGWGDFCALRDQLGSLEPADFLHSRELNQVGEIRDPFEDQ